MAEIKRYQNFNDFVRFNQKFLDSNPFLYFNLIRTINRVLEGQVPLRNFFNVIDDSHFSCGLTVENECLLYADTATDEMISLIAEGLEFKEFKRYQFFGTKNVLDLLFEQFRVKYSEQKHRKYYDCSKVTMPFRYADGQAAMGEMHRFSELVQFSQMFNCEFYENEKPLENIEDIIYTGLIERNIYQWISSNQLVAMAQVMYEVHDYPVIGHVFTHPNFRGKGYASSLVHKITKEIIEHSQEKCCLMTNAYNPASNLAFQKVGYKLIGEYVNRFKEE